MNVSIAGRSLCFRSCFLSISMVRVLLYPTLTPFICLPRVSTFFVSPLHCSQHAPHISLPIHPVCFSLRTGLAGRLCSLFYYSRCCTLLTRLARSLPSFPPFFFFTYFPENLLGLSVYRSVIVKPIAFFPLSKHKFFHVPSPSLSIVFCSRSIALFAHRS